MLKKLWNDPVWSKVIATAIVGFVVLIGTYLLNLWPTISDSGHRELRESNSEIQKPVEPPISKPKQPDSAPSPPIKQSRKDKERGMRAQAVPAVPPLTQEEVKLPEVPKPQGQPNLPTSEEPLAMRLAKVCKQPVVGLTRRPEAFLTIWIEMLLRLRETKFEPDRTFQNLYKIKDRIRDPNYSTADDFFRESLYTARCLEDVGEVKLKNLGTHEKYLDKDFENQLIVFRDP